MKRFGVPLWLTVIGLVVCFIFVVPAFVFDPSATWVDHLDRAANVAQIVGLFAVALAFPQLRSMILEQRRIADELNRQPKLTISFEQPGEVHKTLTLDLRSRAGGVETICVVVENKGTRDATHINVTIAMNGHAEPAREIEGRDVATFTRSGVNDALMALREEPYLHVGALLFADLPLRFPYENGTYTLGVTARCGEVPFDFMGELTLVTVAE